LKHLSRKRKRNQIEIPLVKAIETGIAHPEVFFKKTLWEFNLLVNIL